MEADAAPAPKDDGSVVRAGDAPGAGSSDGVTGRAAGASTGEAERRRGQRMFGALLGHLKSAKSALEQQQDLIKRQTDRKVEAERASVVRVEQRVKRQREEHEREASDRRERARLEGVVRTCNAEADTLAQASRRASSLREQPLLRESSVPLLLTVAEPNLFWSPAEPWPDMDTLVVQSKSRYRELISRESDKAATAILALRRRAGDAQRAIDSIGGAVHEPVAAVTSAASSSSAASSAASSSRAGVADPDLNASEAAAKRIRSDHSVSDPATASEAAPAAAPDHHDETAPPARDEPVTEDRPVAEDQPVAEDRPVPEDRPVAEAGPAAQEVPTAEDAADPDEDLIRDILAQQ